MSIDTDLTTDQQDDEPAVIGELLTPTEAVVEVRRRAGLAVVLGAGASVTAVAYLARAISGGGVLDWALAVVLGVIGMVELAALVDARTPLLVADDLGVRLRLGRTWVGLPWQGIQVLEHQPRHGWHDGRLVARPSFVGRVLEDLDPPARRVARVNRRLHGAPLAVPLGVATRVVGAGGDLTEALRTLADGRAVVAVPESDATDTTGPVDEIDEIDEMDEVHEVPETGQIEEPEEAGDPVTSGETDTAAPHRRRLPDPRPAIARLVSDVAGWFDRPGTEKDVATGETGPAVVDHGPDATGADVPTTAPSIPLEPVVASATPEPARDPVPAARADVRHESRAALEDPATAAADPLEEETQVWADLHLESRDEEVEQHLLIDDYVAQPPADPVIGPELAGARTRLGLTVDQLAERTRIRPHVIEALELDDFSACGGDFYARGHLRTLARVLGLDVAPLLSAYDERYADAPIDPRRVFEAELAGAGSIRATRGGPNWSVLVAAVMALILCWSVARLVTGGTGRPEDHAVLSGSGGPNHVTMTTAKPVPVTLRAAVGGARVVVRDGNDRLVFSGDLAYGQSHTLRAAPPVRVQSTDGAVRVTVAGHDRGAMGPAGRPATASYVAR
jgi:transcriptional regulator with XRE-family HTH domain